METKTKAVVSAPVLTLHQKLHKAKQSIGKVAKNATNPHFKKSYSDINAITEAVEPILLENGLLLLQPIQGNSVCTQIICIDSNELIESCMELPAGLNPQQVGSCSDILEGIHLSSKPYVLYNLLDDDANLASVAPKAAKPAITPERFDEALVAIQEGRFTIPKLKAAFELTDLQTKAIMLL
jgi:hypothetical protein